MMKRFNLGKPLRICVCGHCYWFVYAFDAYYPSA